MEKIGTKTIYFFEETTLYKACKNYLCINYDNVTKSIRYYLKKHSNEYSLTNMTELIFFLVNKYKILKIRRQQKKIISDIINNLKVNIRYASKVLKINYKKIYQLKKYQYSIREALLIIYFMGDIEKEIKSITTKRLKQISNTSYLEKTNKVNELLCIYYLTKDSLIYERIFNLYYDKFKRLIYKVSRMFYLKLQVFDVEDIMVDLKIKLIEVLKDSRIVGNNAKQIDSYVSKTMFGVTYKKIFEMKMLSKEIHLEDKIYDDLTYLDIIPSK